MGLECHSPIRCTPPPPPSFPLRLSLSLSKCHYSCTLQTAERYANKRQPKPPRARRCIISCGGSTLIELRLQLGAPALQGFDPPPASPLHRMEQRGRRCNSTAVKTRHPGATWSGSDHSGSAGRNSGTLSFCIYSSFFLQLGLSFTSASYLPPVI